jgi:hypothetical protein
MNSLRYIQITANEPIAFVDVPTRIHYLLMPGEVPNRNSPFWDLTIGGTPVATGDASDNVHLITCERVSELAEELQKRLWGELETRAQSNHDMMPGWYEGLKPEFERLRDFFVSVSKKGNAILRV